MMASTDRRPSGIRAAAVDSERESRVDSQSRNRRRPLTIVKHSALAWSILSVYFVISLIAAPAIAIERFVRRGRHDDIPPAP